MKSFVVSRNYGYFKCAKCNTIFIVPDDEDFICDCCGSTDSCSPNWDEVVNRKIRILRTNGYVIHAPYSYYEI